MTNIRTITLSGDEKNVAFCGSNAWLRNDSTSMVYASANPGLSAGKDGVVSIPAGDSAPVFSANGSIYISGTGIVQLVGSDYSSNPFKTSAHSSGSGADAVARAAIEAHSGNSAVHVSAEEKILWNSKVDAGSLPTSLPANGGSAYTAKHQIISYLGIGIDILDHIKKEVPDMHSCFFGVTNCPSCPAEYGYDPAKNDFYYLVNRYTENYASILAFDVLSNNIFLNTQIAGSWCGWHKLSSNIADSMKDLSGSAVIKIDYSGDAMDHADCIAAFDASDPDNVKIKPLPLSKLTGSYTSSEFVTKSEFNKLVNRVNRLENDMSQTTDLAV